jgi:hypothetical protein
MKNCLVVIVIFLLLGIFSCTPSAKKMDRSAMVVLLEQYLAALAKHDPSSVPLAKDVKLVENTEVTPIGKGLWETATGGPTEFKIFAADPVAGQIGFIGVIKENNKPTILGARLKVVNGKITEIDHLVIHSDSLPLNPNMSKVRPGLIEPIKPSERVPRDEMLKIANSYYEAIVQDNGNLVFISSYYAQNVD